MDVLEVYGPPPVLKKDVFLENSFLENFYVKTCKNDFKT